MKSYGRDIAHHEQEPTMYHPNDLIRIGQQHLDELRQVADHRRLARLMRVRAGTQPPL